MSDTPTKKTGQRPNILILMPDQWRADCLSCAGHPIVQTPHVDRLAAEGIRCERAYTTSPVCMPARSSFLSGLYCHNHGQWSNYGRLPDTADTYLHHVRPAGYRTAQIGKSHLYGHYGQHLRECEPYMRNLGWDDILEATGPLATCTTDSIMTDHWRLKGCLDTFREDYRRRAATRGLDTWPSPMPQGETLDDFVGRTATEYLRGYNQPEPWLTFVGFGGPHSPWDPPADWLAHYDWRDMDPSTPAASPDPWLPEAAAVHQQGLQRTDPRHTAEIKARIRALYYAKISHIDDWIGRIWRVVEERGWADNTAVVFWSDHGEMLGDKGRYHKEVFYEPSVRIPFIVRLPDRQGAGQVRRQLVSLVDGFPTLLDLAGCPPRKGEFGRSLLPLASDAAAATHDAVFSEIDVRTMIRNDRHKMVVGRDGAVLKLYDLEQDPGETVNAVGRSGSEPVISALRERLLRWHLETATDNGRLCQKG